MPKTMWDQCELTGIYIDGSDGFISRASDDLSTIRGRPIGEELLKLISRRTRQYQTGGDWTESKTLTIQRSALDSGRGTFSLADLGTSVAVQEAGKSEVRTLPPPGRLPKAGTGLSTLVLYGPNLEQEYTRVLQIGTPPFIVLAHELIHALHTLGGDLMEPYEQPHGMAIEEARTVGLGKYSSGRITENAIRAEHNLSKRENYDNGGEVDDLISQL